RAGGGALTDGDHGAARVRHHLRHHQGRPRQRHHGAFADHLPARLHHRRGGVGRRHRRDHGRDHPGAGGPDHTRRRGADVHPGTFERGFTQGVLLAFAVIALAPLVFVVLAALHPSGALLTGIAIPHELSFATFRSAWDDGDFNQLMTSSGIVAVAVVVFTT